MRVPVPSFVPVPSPETIRMISEVLFAAGACLACAGLLSLFLSRRKTEGKASSFAWGLLCVGMALMIDHGVQLLF